MERGDEQILENLRGLPENAVFVDKRYMSSPRIQKYALGYREALKTVDENRASKLTRLDAYRDAVNNQKQAKAIATIVKFISPVQEYQQESIINLKVDKRQDRGGGKRFLTEEYGSRKVPLPQAKTTSVPNRTGPLKTVNTGRFRDWNPDHRAARNAGVSIRYSSRNNEIQCPELGVSSRSLRGRTGSSSGSGRVFSSSGSSSGGGGSGSGSITGGSSTIGSSTTGGSIALSQHPAIKMPAISTMNKLIILCISPLLSRKRESYSDWILPRVRTPCSVRPDCRDAQWAY